MNNISITKEFGMRGITRIWPLLKSTPTWGQEWEMEGEKEEDNDSEFLIYVKFLKLFKFSKFLTF